MTTPIKVLILVPYESALGGITNYYTCLKPLFSVPVTYLQRGSKIQPFTESIHYKVTRIVLDTFRYVKCLRCREFTLVHLNTSLSIKSALRDIVYVVLAGFFKKKVIVFFRGWDVDQVQIIERNYLWFIRKVFFKCEAIITLTEESKKSLVRWGFNRKIYLETTLVDDNLLAGFDFNATQLEREKSTLTILFLSRLQKQKGIYELLEAYKKLKMRYNSIKLVIAGSGTEETNLKTIELPQDVELIGHVSGKSKLDVLKKAHIFVLPSYTEGMPNSVLEAMAFGLSIVCSRVGALPEIVSDRRNGLLLPKIDSQSVFNAIECLIVDRILLRDIAEINYASAQRFYSGNVVKRLEAIYHDVCC